MAKKINLTSAYQGWEYWYLYRKLYVALKYMELPMINLIVDVDYSNAQYNKHHDFIAVGLSLIKEYFEDEIGQYLPIDFDTYRKKICFILFHEIAHYLQRSKYKKWVAHNNLITSKIKYEADRGNFVITNEDYRNFKMEANADKIALILLAKFYGEDEKER